jgi:Tfp pilus assembly protein PilX
LQNYTRVVYHEYRCMYRESERGQVLLLIVLVITVALTVSLSVAARSLLNVRLASEEDQSQRAFSAAEAGLDQALLADAATNGSLTNNASYNATITDVQGTDFLLNNGKIVTMDEGVDLWLSQYSANKNNNYSNPWQGTFTLYWGSQNDSCNAVQTVNTMAALEVLILSGTKNNPIATHYVYDGCGTRRAQNNFTAPGAGVTISGTSFAHSATITLGTNGLVARIIPLYANAYTARKCY